jgi:anaerobic selenocysteine-containing dehydrogenase
MYEAGNAGDILIEIARGLGGTIAESFPWNNMVEALRERAQGLYDSHRGVVYAPVFPAATEEVEKREPSPTTDYATFSLFWSALVQSACWYDASPSKGGTGKILTTPSGKFEFYSQRLQKAFGLADDFNCMPHYVEPTPRPEGFDLLIMPENLVVMADNGGGTPPLLIKQLGNDVLVQNDLFVQLNPITALYQGVKDGDGVILESPEGKVKVRIRIFPGVHEGVVLIPLGFGHTAYDQFLREKGVNAHRIIEAGKDTVSGLPTWWAAPGRIYKV